LPKPHANKPDVSVETLIGGLPPEIVSAFGELRSLIKLAVAGALEKVNPGWRSLNFSDPGVGYFCGLFPFPDKIDVAFEFGVLLEDPDHLFDSLGRQVGFLRIRSPKDIRRAPFKRMLKAAISLPEDRATRLALVRSGARPSSAMKPARQPRHHKDPRAA